MTMPDLAVVVVDPEGRPGVHLAGQCWAINPRLASPIRSTSWAEVWAKGWGCALCHTCQRIMARQVAAST